VGGASPLINAVLPVAAVRVPPASNVYLFIRGAKFLPRPTIQAEQPISSSSSHFTCFAT
jgi:hypothetical protein